MLKLLSFSEGGTGHAGKFTIEAEEVLEGNGGKSCRLLANKNAFFCFNGLMEALIIATPLHEAASMFVYNNNFTRISNHVVLVAMEKRFGAKSLLEMINDPGIVRRIESFNAQNLLNFLDTLIGQCDRATFFIDNIIRIRNRVFVDRRNGQNGFFDLQIRLIVKLRRDDILVAQRIRLQRIFANGRTTRRKALDRGSPFPAKADAYDAL